MTTKTLSLEEVSSRVTSGGTPSRKQPDYYSTEEAGHLWIKSKELLDSSISDSEEKISDLGLKKSSAKYVDEGSVLIAMYGANVGQLGWLKKPATVNQAICSLTVNKEVANHRWLFYKLLNDRHRLIAMAQGAAQQNISQSKIKNFEIKVPTLDVQFRIASILSAYDDLIENNTRRIEILEEMARRLYEEWFVHFRFPGHEEVSFKESELGEIPEGWEVCKLIDLVDFIGGAQPPKSQHIYEAKEGYVRFVQNRDYRSDGHLTYIPESKRNKICGRLDILVDKYGEAGKARFGIAGAYNVALAKIVPKNESYREWLRGLLSMTQTQEYLLGASQAATRPSLNKAHLNFPVVLPSESVAERFGHQVLPMLQLILALKDKTANLRAQRDLLLPKLVSGEIDVSKIPVPEDKEVEAA